MAQSPEALELKERTRRFKDAMRRTIGYSIQKEQPKRLGFQDSEGSTLLLVPAGRRDQPDQYYFHEAGGTGYQGQAFLQPGALEDWQIRYGTPILIKRNAVSGEWEITGLDTRYAAQFFNDVDVDSRLIVTYENIAPGLLTSTDPNSMQARVLSGSYRSGAQKKFFETQLTVNWGEAPANSNLPQTSSTSRYTLVQLDFETGGLSYKYGNNFPSTLSRGQIFNINQEEGNNLYFPQPDTDFFACGYIRLSTKQIQISRQDIWPLQDYLSLGGAGSPNVATDVLNRIITKKSDGHVLTSKITGNVIYQRTSPTEE